MNDIDDTIKLAEEFQATGISAIGVHGRKINERPQHFNNTSMYLLELARIHRLTACANVEKSNGDSELIFGSSE